MPDFLAPYASALLALGLLTLAQTAQGFLAGLIKNGMEKQPPGMALEGGYADFGWRVARTYMNGVENYAAIVGAALLAMIAGANPALVAWLVWIIVGLRLAYWPIYYAGIGAHGGGIRSVVFVASVVANVVLAAVAVLALL
jgi:uncharacterized MAPEG superfamily protein